MSDPTLLVLAGLADGDKHGYAMLEDIESFAQSLMDRLTKFAARLYPRWWRDRYGEEFAALLEDARPGFRGTLDVLKGAMTMQLFTFSAKRVLSIGSMAGLLLGFAASFSLTPQFESRAVVSVAIPQDDNGSGVGAAVNQLSMEVMGRETLTGLIESLSLYRELSAEDRLETMRRNIRLSSTSVSAEGHQTPGFELKFRHPDAATARKVASALTSAYIDANIRPRAGQTGEHAMLEVREVALQPGAPLSPNRSVIAPSGLGAGFGLTALVGLGICLRRKRQSA